LPASLFGRAVLTLVFTFGLFALMTFFTVVNYALIPLADRSTRDLAAFMELSALTLVQLAPPLRAAYREKLDREYDLRLLDEGAGPGQLEDYFFPYVRRLQMALADRLGYPVEIKSNRIDGERWFWLRLDAGGERVWVGFPRSRIHTRPLQGVLVVLVVSALLVLLSAAVLARRVTAPLEGLSRAAEQVAYGGLPTPLPEKGPRELACLARQFNEMSRQVRELLGNRTVLLAGISHDLRTPLTRLRLALEMLSPELDTELRERMERDLEEMNDLIGQVLVLGQTLGAGERQAVDLRELVIDLADGRPRLQCTASASCPYRVDPLALRRILGNLVENALRYSHDRVEMHLDCRHRPPVIFVLDRGPGIPEGEREAVFRPFYRLEQSRSRQTGGSGLGLAIARQLAVANGIEIRLGPRQGGGTVASVHLPSAGGHNGVKPVPESG
jgi:two-component system osmolarity sensor histidine kinase EnvZ